MSVLSAADLQIAKTSIAQGRLAQAIEVLTPFATALFTTNMASELPPFLHFWRDMANLLRDAGLFDAAAKSFEMAQSSGLPAEVAQLELGATWLAAGDFEKALTYLTPLTGSHPQNAVARNLRTIALFESGEHQVALTEWVACGKMAGRDRYPFCTEPFHLALAALAMEHFLHAHARRVPVALPEVQPVAAPGMTAQARIEHIDQAIQQHRFAEAFAWLEFEKNQPKAQISPLSFLHAVALGEMGHWQEARQVILPALESKSVEPLAWSFYAYSLVQCGDAETALRILDHIVPVGPDDYFSTYFRGCAWLALGQRATALCHFQLAFCHYFFDTSEMVLLPAWEKVRAILTTGVEAR